MRRWVILLASHAAAIGTGFAVGIYLLPILTAPDSPEQAMLEAAAQTAVYRAEFRRDLKGSDLLHWGEGTVSLSPAQVIHAGRLAPGPDYKLYLVPEFVEDEAQFLAVKDSALRIGDVRSFNGFIVDLPPGTDPEAYTTVLVWCEAFGEFITSAQYR
jgi:hypothetical protein